MGVEVGGIAAKASRIFTFLRILLVPPPPDARKPLCRARAKPAAADRLGTAVPPEAFGPIVFGFIAKFHFGTHATSRTVERPRSYIANCFNGLPPP
jgi:hypothetical protein